MFEQVLSIDRMENAVSLFGSFDENIRLIESEFSVTVLNRGSDLKISGEAENVAKATTAIERLLALIRAKLFPIKTCDMSYLLLRTAKRTSLCPYRAIASA